jgi:hypothetical protein
VASRARPGARAKQFRHAMGCLSFEASLGSASRRSMVRPNFRPMLVRSCPVRKQDRCHAAGSAQIPLFSERWNDGSTLPCQHRGDQKFGILLLSGHNVGIQDRASASIPAKPGGTWVAPGSRLDRRRLSDDRVCVGQIPDRA